MPDETTVAAEETKPEPIVIRPPGAESEEKVHNG